MKYRKTNLNLIFGIVLIGLVVMPVLFGFIFLPFDPEAMDVTNKFAAPSFSHLFGTDNFGRDIFSRIVKGTGTTLGVALITVTIGALIGTLVGALTGYFGGIIDEILMRVNDTLASFPSILLALVAVSLLDAGTLNICIALGVVFIPSFARIMREEFLTERGRDYVENAKLMGASSIRIIFVHIFPNTLPVLVSTVLVGLNNAILAEAGLSYLGLGVQPPTPSLGRMLSEAQVYIFNAPWYVISDCLVIVLIILGVTLVGENIGVSGVSLTSVKRRLKKLREEQNTVMDSVKDKCLVLKDVSIAFIDDNGLSPTVNKLNLELTNGEIIGIVGESGSGKSLSAQSIMGILPDKAYVTGGSIILKTEGSEPIDLLKLSERELSKLRGREIAMVFQEPQTALNPLYTVGEQLDEMLDLHHPEMTPGQQRTRILETMADTGLNDVERLYDMYPHELSGGMKQRVCIAMAVLGGARIIIADEPTTALDKDTEKVILDIFKELNRKYGTSIILISHDLEVISSICERALIMKDGEIVEELTVENFYIDKSFSVPVTEYGSRLLEAAYADKSYVEECCTEEKGADGSKTVSESDKLPIVSLSDFSVSYKEKKTGLFKKAKLKTVIKGINLDIERGSATGIVGKSGCGKTTLVKAIAGINKLTSGKMVLNSQTPAYVFQDPKSSLNPYMTVKRLLLEPFLIRRTKRSVAEKEVSDMLLEVGLSGELMERRVSELSGGQRQRVAICLALLLKRELIILDEPVSAVDVTLREQIIELLMALKRKHGLTYIIISHDKRLIERVCNKVYTM